MASIVEQDRDIKAKVSLPPESVRHGFHACQRGKAEQVARCGYRRPGQELGSPIPPANACVVCVDLIPNACSLCDWAGI